MEQFLADHLMVLVKEVRIKTQKGLGQDSKGAGQSQVSRPQVNA